MFCKFCFDSNNTNFNTHNTKNSKNQIICPILKKTQCYNHEDYRNTNKFCLLIEDDKDNTETEDTLPPLSDIIWGIGFRSTMNISWADQVNA